MRPLRRQIAESFEAEHGAATREYAAIRERRSARFEAPPDAAQQAAAGSPLGGDDDRRSGPGRLRPGIARHPCASWTPLAGVAGHRPAGRRVAAAAGAVAAVIPNRRSPARCLEHHPAQRFTQALELAREQFQRLSAQKIAAAVHGLWPMLALFFVLWGLLRLSGRRVAGRGRSRTGWPSAAPAASPPSSSSSCVWLHAHRPPADDRAYLPLRRTLLEAGLDRPAVLETAKAECRRLYAAIDARHNAEIKKAEERFAAAASRNDAAPSSRRLQQADETYRPRLAAMVAQRDQALAEAEAKYPPLIAELESGYAAAVGGPPPAVRRGDRGEPAAVRTGNGPK